MTNSHSLVYLLPLLAVRAIYYEPRLFVLLEQELLAGEELWWFENNHIQEILKNKTMLLRHNGDCEKCNNIVSFQIIKRNGNLNKYMPGMIKQKKRTETTITLYQHNILKYS